VDGVDGVAGVDGVDAAKRCGKGDSSWD